MLKMINDEMGHFELIGSILKLGDNFDEKGSTFLVEELFNPISGICYSLTPHESYKISIKDSIFIRIVFPEEGAIPPVAISFVNPEDRYGFVLPDMEYLEPLAMIQYPGTFSGIQYRKMVMNYLSSKRNCKNDHEEGSYMKCIIKKQVECYQIIGPQRGCNCIPYNILKTYFEMYPLNSWNSCQSNWEYRTCFGAIHDCFYHKKITDNCPKPCKRVVYKGIGGIANGFPTSSNTVSYTHLTLPTILLV